MKKTERFQNIKLDIQTEDFDPSNDIMGVIRMEMRKLMRIYGNIVGADVYLKESNRSEPDNKMARIRVGVPGHSLFAEASSTTWIQALTDVSGNLRSQILSRP
jgi:putative sigma-54 modulation protein